MILVMNVKKIRQSKGLSLSLLARKSVVSKSHLSYIKNNEKYCELILMIGISEIYRECYINNELIQRLEIDEDVNNIYFRYKKYIDNIIDFYVGCDDEYSGVHLYTELESGVEPYNLQCKS